MIEYRGMCANWKYVVLTFPAVAKPRSLHQMPERSGGLKLETTCRQWSKAEQLTVLRRPA